LRGSYLKLMDQKSNPPAANAAQAGGGRGGRGGFGDTPLSEDTKSEIRGELITLRDDIRRAIPRTTDRETLMHLQGAEHEIGDILDPKK